MQLAVRVLQQTVQDEGSSLILLVDDHAKLQGLRIAQVEMQLDELRRGMADVDACVVDVGRAIRRNPLRGFHRRLNQGPLAHLRARILEFTA